MSRFTIAWLLGALAAAGCDRAKPIPPVTESPATRPARSDETGPKQNPGEPPLKNLVEAKAPETDPYDRDWRRERSVQADALRVKAKGAIQRLQADGAEVTTFSGDLELWFALKAGSAGEGGTIKPEHLQLLRVAGPSGLTISGFPLSDAGLAQLAALRCLREFHVEQGKVTATGLTALRSLQSLRWLTFGEFNPDRPPFDCTGDGFEVLTACPDLNEVYVWRAGVTDTGLAAMARLPGLKQLRLDGNRITDAGLTALRSQTELRILSLSRNRLTGEGLRALTGLPKLSTLYLNACPVTPAGMAAVAGLTELRFLELEDCPATDADVAGFTGLRLQGLSLSGTKITDAGMVTVGKIRTLTLLDLNRTAVTDVGLKALADLPNLEHLRVRDTKITDAGLDVLHKCPRLARVSVSARQKLTPDAIKRLESAKPGLQLTVFDD